MRRRTHLDVAHDPLHARCGDARRRREQHPGADARGVTGGGGARQLEDVVERVDTRARGVALGHAVVRHVHLAAGGGVAVHRIPLAIDQRTRDAETVRGRQGSALVRRARRAEVGNGQVVEVEVARAVNGELGVTTAAGAGLGNRIGQRQ